MRYVENINIHNNIVKIMINVTKFLGMLFYIANFYVDHAQIQVKNIKDMNR